MTIAFLQFHPKTDSDRIINSKTPLERSPLLNRSIGYSGTSERIAGGAAPASIETHSFSVNLCHLREAKTPDILTVKSCVIFRTTTNQLDNLPC